MKKRIFGFLAIIAITFAAFSFTACGDEDDKNEDLAASNCVFTSFTAEDFDGNIVDETVFEGFNVTMVNVWGTYCEPCKTELPELAGLNAEYKDLKFQIIGIPIDVNKQTSADARQLIEETGANYRHLRVSPSIKSFITGIKSVPYTIFVNENGEQIGKAYTGSKSKTEWKKLIDRMLEFVNK